MITVGDDDRPGAPSLGGVDEPAVFLGVIFEPSRGGRTGEDDGDDALRNDDVPETDVDEIHG